MRRVIALVSSTTLSLPGLASVAHPTSGRLRDASEHAPPAAVRGAGISHRVVRQGPVRSLAEAADARGVEPRDVVKTLVVRRGGDDYRFVLVRGDRTMSWTKRRGRL